MEHPVPPARAVIIDRFSFVAEALRVALNRQPDIEVVDVFSEMHASVVERIRSLHPDILLVELKTSGPDLVRHLHAEFPATPIVALATVYSAAQERAAIAAGAAGYVEKDHGGGDFAETIRGVLSRSG